MTPRNSLTFHGDVGPPQLPSAQRPAPSAQRPAPSAQRPAPSAQRPAPSAQRPAPSAQRPAPSAQRPAPSAQRPAPSAQRPAPSAQRPAPSAQRPAPSAPLASAPERSRRHPPAVRTCDELAKRSRGSAPPDPDARLRPDRRRADNRARASRAGRARGCVDHGDNARWAGAGRPCLHRVYFLGVEPAGRRRRVSHPRARIPDRGPDPVCNTSESQCRTLARSCSHRHPRQRRRRRKLYEATP